MDAMLSHTHIVLSKCPFHNTKSMFYTENVLIRRYIPKIAPNCGRKGWKEVQLFGLNCFWTLNALDEHWVAGYFL